MREFNTIITLTKSGSLRGVLKERLEKANIVTRQVWGMVGRKFKDYFKRRMMMFYSLILGVMMHGIELNKMRKKCRNGKNSNKIHQMVTRVESVHVRLHSFGGDK